MRLMDAHSWFPRSRKKFSGYLTCTNYRHKIEELMTCLGLGSFESWAR